MHPDVMSEQVSLAVVVSYLIERAKHSNWRLFSWMSTKTDRVNRMLAVLGALAATAGLHFAFEMQEGVLTVSGLTGGNLQHFGWEAFKAFVFQETAYRAALKPKTEAGG